MSDDPASARSPSPTPPPILGRYGSPSALGILPPSPPPASSSSGSARPAAAAPLASPPSSSSLPNVAASSSSHQQQPERPRGRPRGPSDRPMQPQQQQPQPQPPPSPDAASSPSHSGPRCPCNERVAALEKELAKEQEKAAKLRTNLENARRAIVMLVVGADAEERPAEANSATPPGAAVHSGLLSPAAEHENYSPALVAAAEAEAEEAVLRAGREGRLPAAESARELVAGVCAKHRQQRGQNESVRRKAALKAAGGELAQYERLAATRELTREEAAAREAAQARLDGERTHYALWKNLLQAERSLRKEQKRKQLSPQKLPQEPAVSSPVTESAFSSRSSPLSPTASAALTHTLKRPSSSLAGAARASPTKQAAPSPRRSSAPVDSRQHRRPESGGEEQRGSAPAVQEWAVPSSPASSSRPAAAVQALRSPLSTRIAPVRSTPPTLDRMVGEPRINWMPFVLPPTRTTATVQVSAAAPPPARGQQPDQPGGSQARPEGKDGEEEEGPLDLRVPANKKPSGV